MSHPAIYLLMYAQPRPGAKSPAADLSHRLLKEHIRRVAAAGRLRFSEDRAADLFHASACGTVLTLLAQAEEHRDRHLSEVAREAAIGTITVGATATDAPALETSGMAAAVALRAILPEVQALSAGERALLTEWLDRLAASRR